MGGLPGDVRTAIFGRSTEYRLHHFLHNMWVDRWEVERSCGGAVARLLFKVAVCFLWMHVCVCTYVYEIEYVVVVQ
jgi:hypothetical protein